MRTIKFRGKGIKSGQWFYGSAVSFGNKAYIFKMFRLLRMEHAEVDPETIGQFTGLYDKNGKAIYEGDIISFYELKTYCINPDCEPHLLGYSYRLVKLTQAVRFEDASFGVDNEFTFITLDCCGCWVDDNIEELKNDPYFDDNGYDLDSIVGMEVIGNIHDNPELLEKGGEQ